MARNELQKDFEQLIKKVNVQKDALMKRIKAVNYKDAAVDDSVWESFMTTVTEFQEQISNMMTVLYDKNEELGNALMEMFDAIDLEADKLPDEEEIEGDEDNSVDEELDSISNNNSFEEVE